MFPKFSKGYKLAILLQILTLMFCACKPASQAESSSAPTNPASPTIISQNSTATPNPGGSDGLKFEEMRGTTPPAPVDFRLTAQEGGIRLDWTPAPPADIPHSYSNAILYYNVYRHLEGETDLLLLTTVEAPYYVDKNVSKGIIYYYAVSAVHEGPLEGERTDELSISMP